MVKHATVAICLIGLAIGVGFSIAKRLEPQFSPPSVSRLGKYKTAAVSSDGVPCSDIGR